MKRILLLSIFFFAFFLSQSQNLSYTCPRDTVLGCNTACLTLKARFPDIRALGTDYTFTDATPVSVCRPYAPPDGAGPSTGITVDDYYSDVIPLGFSFPFYGTMYTSCVASTNGYISFDISLANAPAAWTLNGNVPSTGYDKGLVMGPWHDLDPDPTITTSPTEKIKYNIVGTAPNRKWVLSFYKVPQFDCNDLIENTQQIVLHETSGVIEVFIFDKQICADWNNGRAMVGLQDMTQTKGIVPPGRGAADPPWGSIGMNEVWRFIPTGGAPLYRSVELLDASGTTVATGDTSRVNINTYETTFPNVCPPAGASLYVVKTTYAQLNNPAATYFSLDTINVIRQAALPVTATMTPTTCGGSTGTVTASSAGTPPYQYSIDGGPLQASNVFTGVAQGTHVVYSIDATGCNNTFNIDVTSISSLTNTFVKSNTSCPGLNNGNITVTPTAGVAPYLFSIDGGVTTQGSGTFLNLAPGTYTVTFTDVNGCTGTTTSITIAAGSGIDANETTTGTSCNGISDGTATITPTSGTGPYTYSLDGGTAQASNVITGISSGSHNVTVTDASGCTGSVFIFISSGSGLVATYTTAPSSCPGVNNATITVTPTNGVAPYTYSLDGGAYQASNIILCSPSIHTVTIKDANGCTGTITVATTGGFGITGTASSTASSCPGATNGSITITPTTGTAPYTYSIDGGTFQASNVFSGVTSGPHTVIMKDANGCTATFNVTVVTGAAIAFTTSSTATSCPGVNNGTITVTPTTGSAPYSYSIDGGVTFFPLVGNIITGLAGGTITVIIKDATGCTGTSNVVVAAGTSIAGTIASTATSCPGVNNGTITVTATSGTAPYTYSLDGGTFQASNIFSGVTSGPHIATIKDANGCTGTVNVTVGPGTGITGTATATTTSCAGVSNATVTVNPSTGLAPYSYSIDGGSNQASNIFTGIAAGPHVTTFQDANGCIGTANVTVTDGAGITGTAASVATSCPGVDNGSVTVTPTTGLAPYTYTLDGGTAQPSNIFNGLTAGPHVASFQDANGCVGTVNVTVSAGTGLTGAATAIATSCPGVDNGSVTVNPATGTAPYTYSIDGGTSQASNIFTGLAAGPHVATFQDAIGCTGTANVNVPGGSGLAITSSSTGTSCPGVNNGSITLTPATGTAPYTYSTDGGTTYVPLGAGTITAVAAGPYTIIVKDAIGCTGTINITVTQGAVLSVNLSSTGTSCPGVNNGTITLVSTSGLAPYQYSTDGGTTYQPMPLGDILTGITAGVNSITIKDANGCVGSANITVAAGPNLAGSAVPTATGCPGVNNGSITVTPTSGTSPYNYSIDGGTTWQPAGLFSNLAPGAYTIIFKDNIGCTGTVSATVLTGSGLTAAPPVITATSCPGVDNGTVSITPTSGTAPYQFSIDGGTPQPGSTYTFTNLTAAVHTIDFTDVLGCAGTVTVTVPSGVNLTSTTAPLNPPCANINDGTITVTPTSGVSPYLYSIDGGTTTQASPVFPNLSPGAYTITFTDNIGCTGTTSITLTTHTAIGTTISLTKPLCNGNSNGTIKLTPSGGVAPYQFSKDIGATYQASGTFSGLSAGTYSFRIKDNVGCIKDTTATLTEPTVLTANASSPTAASCNGNDGNITVTTNSGGTAPYQYSIDNGTTYQSSNIFIVSSGNYPNIIVKDNNGCTANVPGIVTVSLSNTMFVNAGKDSTICAGQSVQFQPQTNAGTSIFHWYSVDPLVPIPTGTIDYDTLKNATVTPLDSFTYVLQAQWGVCPPETDTISIFVKHKPIVNAGENQAICFEDSTAILQGSASNLSGPVNYSWTPSDHLSTPDAPSTLAILHTTTNYTLTVTDNYGCNFVVPDDVIVALQPPVPAFAGNDTIAVPNQPQQLMASGGVSYEWSPSAPLNLSNVQNPVAILTHDQQFTVTVTDIAGCVGSATVFIKVYTGPSYHVPNAFSPNADGLNDVFRVVPAGIVNTEYFRIFNRYGEMIFETNKWMQGWDGFYLGKPQPVGNYIWMVKGTTITGKVIEAKGTVMLIR